MHEKIHDNTTANSAAQSTAQSESAQRWYEPMHRWWAPAHRRLTWTRARLRAVRQSAVAVWIAVLRPLLTSVGRRLASLSLPPSLTALSRSVGLWPVQVWRTVRQSRLGQLTGRIGLTPAPVAQRAFAVGLLGCLAVGAVTQGVAAIRPGAEFDAQTVATALAERDTGDRASRSTQRAKPKASPAKPAKKSAKASKPKPVAGLDQTQMNNAAIIVATGQRMGMPKRAYVVAIATAMQESRLYNLASDVLPESYRYAHQGSGSDHDSVGLFQQRPSTGWGSVKNLMRPEYAASQFYKALRGISGWQQMAVTYAAQSVQGSAFPDAYAQHEWVAKKVVDALT